MTPIQPYKVALTQSPDQADSAMADARTNEMKMTVELAQANLGVRLVKGQNELAAMCREYPLELERITCKMNELAHLRRTIKLHDGLSKTLFPASV